MKKILFLLIITSIASYINGQNITVVGKVHAFKNLPLNKIEVIAKKAKSKALTDSQGNFRIICNSRDKLEFTGNGFQKTTFLINSNSSNVNSIWVKMLFIDREKNQIASVKNGHITQEKLLNSIQSYPEYNYNYNTYPDIFTAIDRIYASNDKIRVQGEAVYISSNNFGSSQNISAIYIVNGKRSLDISQLLMRNIESIKVIPDGSTEYGLNASEGVVIITTLKN